MLEQMLIELNNIERTSKACKKKIPDKLLKNYEQLETKDIDSVVLTHHGKDFLFQLLCSNSYDSYDIIHISVEDMKKYMDIKEMEQDNELNNSLEFN